MAAQMSAPRQTADKGQANLQANLQASLHTSLHASAVAIGETGILIRGKSGAGKSSLALALLALATQTGRFGCLIGDDRVEISQCNGRLIARGHAAIRGMIERRGDGIVPIAHEPAAVLDLIIDLLPAAEVERHPAPDGRQAEVCGVKLPRLALPCGGSSYDCALLVMARLQQSETI